MSRFGYMNKQFHCQLSTLTIEIQKLSTISIIIYPLYLANFPKYGYITLMTN